MTVYWARPFLALVLRKKGLVKVTFDWILADQSDSVTQILGSNLCVGECSQWEAYLRSRTSCGRCWEFGMALHLKWSTEATMDVSDKPFNAIFRKLGLSSIEQELSIRSWQSRLQCLITQVPTRLGKPAIIYALSLWASTILKQFSVPAKSR